MQKEYIKHKEGDLDSLQITSPRTAGQPGPQVTGEDECCSVRPPVKSEHSHGIGTYIPTVISLLLLLSGIALDFFKVAWFSGPLRFVIFGMAYILVGGTVVKHAFTNIGKGNIFNEFFLMTIATIGAFYIGEYAEGVAVMLFYVIGEHFQEAAVARSRRSIKALIDNRPETVMLKNNDIFEVVDPKNVNPGDIIQVKPGEKVALDGRMLSERASFNTSALTGESMPDTKKKGEIIFAGMINLNQLIELEVTSRFEDSALSKILVLVEEASSRKAKTQKFITKFARVYTPVVVFMALGLTLLPYFFVDTYVFD